MAKKKKQNATAIPADVMNADETTIDELWQEYQDLDGEADEIGRAMDQEDDDPENNEGDIEAWYEARDEFFKRARLVWMREHPGTDPSWGDLDDEFGGRELWKDIL